MHTNLNRPKSPIKLEVGSEVFIGQKELKSNNQFFRTGILFSLACPDLSGTF
jgi:hypothetical protein